MRGTKVPHYTSRATCSELDLSAQLEQPALQDVGRTQELVARGRREVRVHRVDEVVVEDIVQVRVAAQPEPSEDEPPGHADVELIQRLGVQSARLDQRDALGGGRA